MSLHLQYHSDPNTKSQRKKRKKPEISQLALDTFQAFEPFINIFDCGISYDNSPIHLISKAEWRLHRRYKAGERNLAYQNGTKFNPYLDIVRSIYSPQYVHDHIHGGQISYFTSGRRGFGLLYLDIDAHESWQTDEQRAKAVLQKLFPFAYFRASRRGQNGYLKIRYTTIQEFHRIAGVLQGTLKRLFLDLGILCDIEVKGTITLGDKSGSLAKLPFWRKDPEYMRDETDNWGYEQLEMFKACPIVHAVRIEHLAHQVASRIDEERVRAFMDQKKVIKEKAKQDLFEKVARAYAEGTILDLPNLNDIELELPMPCSVCGTNRFSVGAYRYVCNRCGHSIDPHTLSDEQTPTAPPSFVPPPPAPQESSGQERGVRPIQVRFSASLLNLQDASTDDAFRRNHTDIKPFVRAFYKRHGKYPTTEETLDWIRTNNRYSGDWDDRAAKRAKRVEQILRFTNNTFDPSKLSRGKKAVDLTLGKLSWWVRQHFGSGMKARRADISRFNPATMMAPQSQARIPAEFIETFLVVAQFCLKHDPLDNKAVPTNRIKKIWEMVKGGAPWNQKYYQLVRDRLDRMGVIRITDRNHTTGKAWRWQSGDIFPEDSWKDEQKKLKERLPSGDSECRIVCSRERRIHNTLYQDTHDISRSCTDNLLVRPPPWLN